MDSYSFILNSPKPIIMGILNLTEDSFFDGGKYVREKDMVEHTALMIKEGAEIIDIGACSTRPGSRSVDEEQEKKVITNAMKVLKKEFPNSIFSIDTFHSTVAEAAVRQGAAIVNDVSGGSMDPAMFAAVAQLKVPYVLTHIRETPETMQQAPRYENVVKEVGEYFELKIKQLQALGIKEIILDPGFGFGKDLGHNYSLLKGLPLFAKFDLPILAGVSRKAMINKVIGISPANALNGTSVINTIALLNGARILRVHDVKEAVEAVMLVEQYKSASI